MIGTQHSQARARYAPTTASVRGARRFTTEWARKEGLGEAGDDAALVVCELAVNAVLHARTDFEVHLAAVDGSLRVQVCDGSTTMPLPGSMARAGMSGRGLPLVAALAASWGVQAVDGGKCVWAQISPAGGRSTEDASAEELLRLWAGVDAGPPAVPAGSSARRQPVVITVVDLPVDDLLGAKMHMEDLLRELQLLLLHHDARGREEPGREEPGHVAAAGADTDPTQVAVVDLARRLDAAARALDALRLAIRGQALQAAEQGQREVTLVLSVRPDLAATLPGYREAIEDAERLSEHGQLLSHTDAMHRYASVRRRYLDHVIDELSPHF